MKVVALCKTFAGEEWIEAMTLSIYPYVEKIVFVNSDISWTGRVGNTCKSIIEGMMHGNKRMVKRRPVGMDKIDIENKIISLNYNTMNQARQCQLGYKYIQKHIPCDYVMLIDTDEVWDDYDMQEALKFIEKHPNQSAYRTSMYTYIKSPYWRVSPVEPLNPVSFISANLAELGHDARACGLPFAVIHDSKNDKVFYHHFVYVRDTFNTVLEKIVSSHVSEKGNYADMSKWIPEVWNKLPNVERKGGLHPAFGFERNWMGIEQIKKEQLPRILREKTFPIMEKYSE